MKTHDLLSWQPLRWILGVFLLLGLYLLSVPYYLLFHSLIELFSIIVACGMFMIAWNSRRIMKNPYIEFLGIAYLAIAMLDLLHTLAYKGMGVFPQYGPNLPTQFWIAARYLESLSLLLSIAFLRRTFSSLLVLPGYLSGAALIILAIFAGVFPDCFIEGVGLTDFKIVSEYLICLLLLSTVFFLIKTRGLFIFSIWRLILLSISLTIVSELAFTLYVDVYGLFNLVGHFLKLLSFYLLYRAIIVASLKRPYEVLFQNLKQSEQILRTERDNAQMYLDIAGVMLVALDRKGKVTLINKKGVEILGYTEQELLGKHWFPLAIPAPERSRIEGIFQQIMAGDMQSTEYIENRIVTKQGNERIIGWHNAFIRDRNQHIIGTLSSGEDLTERKRIEHDLWLAMEAQKQRAFEFEVLNQMNKSLQICHAEEEAYPIIADVCQKILPSSAGALCLLQDSQLSVAASWGETIPARTSFDAEDCLALQHYHTHNQSPVFSCHDQACAQILFPTNTYQRCLVLNSPQGILGILHLSCISAEHDDVSQKEATVIRIAEQYALSLANLRLREQLKIEAIRDPLTDLYNRRYMEVSLTREWARAERHGHPVAIIMLDIDHFKNFNDTYGHDVGDIVLKELAALLKRHVRTEDIACRYGGEEFLLILPEVRLEVAKYRAEELRVLVHELHITYQGSLLSVTISVGIAVFPQHGHNLKEVIHKADAALYQAKKAGRDRVVVTH